MISCNQYDYIEIACTYNFLVLLTMKSGITLEGVALDTGSNEKREESIKLEVDGEGTWVVLDQVSRIDVLVENPHFKSVVFD